MELKKVLVSKDGDGVIKADKGKTDNGRVFVFGDSSDKVHTGDKVMITAEGGFKVGAIYMGENPAGTLNFKID